MRIVTWNCGGAFRKKYERLHSLGADVYVVQECEDPLRVNDQGYLQWASNFQWIGDHKSKGLGVFVRQDILLTKLDWKDEYEGHRVKHFLPCQINETFQLLAVWTHKNNSPTFGYIGQFWKYLKLNKDKFADVVIAGDFNSNRIWDQWDRWWNHTDVVNELAQSGIESLYHKYFKEQQGQENTPTFFHRSNKKPYHIDYIFAGDSISRQLVQFAIERDQKWLGISDHVPVVADFQIDLSSESRRLDSVG